jgi:hypothetical protein
MAAVAGIVLLAAMYVVTFISALIGTAGAGRLFRFSLGMTIAVPIFLWIFIWCVGKFTDKGSIASLDLLNSNPKEREKMEQALQSMETNAADSDGAQAAKKALDKGRQE